jgi:hypothetical protein
VSAIKERGETPFGEVGDGVVLCFTNRDLKVVQADVGKDFLAVFTRDALSGELDVTLLEKIAFMGVKKDRAHHKLEDGAFDNITIADLVAKVLDALYISVHGDNFKDYMNKTAKAFEEAAAAGNIPPNPNPDTTSSTISEKEVSGVESE